MARLLKQAGETLRTDPADPAFQERVRQAYAELGTVKHTAQRLGVSKDTVRKVVRGERADAESACDLSQVLMLSYPDFSDNSLNAQAV